MYRDQPTAFQNAIIRDHIRCIGELALHLKCLDKNFNPLIATEQQACSDWPLNFPASQELEIYENTKGAVYYAKHSCLNDDFNHYSINCLRLWMNAVTKSQIGGWIIKHVVEEFGLADEGCGRYDSYIRGKEGGGRSKPAWAERIGKKYQWVALYRLASRLHDKVKRPKDTLKPKPVRTPLILMEERKLDPTLTRTALPEQDRNNCWWLKDGVNLAVTKDLDFSSWIALGDDLPPLEKLLQITKNSGQRWIPLTAFIEWSEYKSGLEYNTPYRDTWLDVNGYLVKKPHFNKALKFLAGRNYFGGWLPEAARWLHAFAGEYPWATAYNTEPDWYLGADERVQGAGFGLIHSSNEIVIEWEYDATLPVSIHMEVPTKKLFLPGDLFWNGMDGFDLANRQTVFFDPRFKYGGPAALLSDIDDLVLRLDKIGYRLLWTVLGEKRILGDYNNQTPGISYSQLAWLTKNGTIEVGSRHFFDKY